MKDVTGTTHLPYPLQRGCICLPNRATVGTEVHDELLDEVSHQLPAHHPAIVLQPGLMTDPLPHLTKTQSKTWSYDL